MYVLGIIIAVLIGIVIGVMLDVDSFAGKIFYAIAAIMKPKSTDKDK